ncbi:hypothetical protein C9374_003191 [Naegleria lovaniensis]|uniref:Protein kinase domain-containing protein n=1 Tax=Naegleria lovaniensis TaxID=51637 RepID=A0AA88GS68_NAELO|nr:uncharacterized protein C9374_003191 [Naegleria lovaniensis]KAG2386042.1 hypothetical protein C9374_003191 [Naegleria lovaniensis]
MGNTSMPRGTATGDFNIEATSNSGPRNYWSTNKNFDADPSDSFMNQAQSTGELNSHQFYSKVALPNTSSHTLSSRPLTSTATSKPPSSTKEVTKPTIRDALTPPQQSSGGFTFQHYNQQAYNNEYLPPPQQSSGYFPETEQVQLFGNTNFQAQPFSQSTGFVTSSPVVQQLPSKTSAKPPSRKSISPNSVFDVTTSPRETERKSFKKVQPKKEQKEEEEEEYSNLLSTTKAPPSLTISVYINFEEKNIFATITDASTLAQLKTLAKDRFNKLQNEDDKNIELYYDSDQVKNIGVTDDNAVNVMKRTFSNKPNDISVLKVVLNKPMDPVNANVEIAYKFSVEYVNNVFQTSTKKFKMKVSSTETISSFIVKIAERCDLPQAKDLYSLQFLDKTFEQFIDIKDMEEMELDKEGVNQLKLKKNTTIAKKFGADSMANYSNAFLGILIKNRYLTTDILGKGGYGIVIGCEDTITNEKLAIKFILSSNDHYDKDEDVRKEEESAKREAMFMEMLQHEHIATVKQVFTWKEVLEETPAFSGNLLFSPLLCILMERYMYGNVMQTILLDQGKKGPISLKLVFQIIFQMSKAVSFIHAQSIIHRDIKPHNMLIRSFDPSTNDIHVVLSDFGTAKSDVHTTRHTQIGTLLFEAPEVLLHHSYGLSADMFSLGVTLFQLLSLNIDYNVSFKLIQNEKECQNEMMNLILRNYASYQGEQAYKDIVLKGMVNIVQRLLKLSPQDRLTSQQLAQELDILEIEIY